MEKEFKKKALGSLTKNRLKAVYNLKPDPEKLSAPLLEGSGLRTFCAACGSYQEVKAEHIAELVGILGVEIIPTKHYFESHACMFCDSKEAGGAFKKISDGKRFSVFGLELDDELDS